MRSDAGVQLVDTLSIPDTEVVTPRDGDVRDALAELNADPDVLYAERDLPVRLASNDTYSSYLWGLPQISAIDAWTRTRGAGVAVAVVDTGVDTTHPDLAGVFTGNAGERGSGRETNGVDDDGNGLVDDWQGWDFVNHDNTVETQSQSHGTHVSGTIAALADNNRGVAGVAPEARILPLKVFGAPGSHASLSVLAEAFAYAGRLGAPVVNASLGGLGSSTTITNIIRAYPNTLYVVAAGNDDADAAVLLPVQRERGQRPVRRRVRRGRRAGELLQLQRHRGRPVRAGRGHPLDGARRRYALHGRHVDGDAARGGRRRAARGGQAGCRQRDAQDRAAELGRRARGPRRRVRDGRSAERERGARRGGRRARTHSGADSDADAGRARADPDAGRTRPHPHAADGHAHAAGADAGRVLAAGLGHRHRAQVRAGHLLRLRCGQGLAVRAPCGHW